MTNPLANLLAQAEVNLAEFGRRAVESVTVPVKLKSQEVVADLTASVKASLRAIIIKVVLGLFAVVMLLIALGYALSALHGYLVTIMGPIEATLAMAGAFLLLAILAFIVMAVWPEKAKAPDPDATTRAMRDAEAAMARARAEAEATARRVQMEARAAASRHERDAADVHDGASGDMKSSLGAIAAALGAAGFRREQAGLRAGLALAEQLKPMQIATLALIGGFLVAARRGR